MSFKSNPFGAAMVWSSRSYMCDSTAALMSTAAFANKISKTKTKTDDNENGNNVDIDDWHEMKNRQYVWNLHRGYWWQWWRR